MRYVRFVLMAGMLALLLAGAALAQGSILPSPLPVTIDGVITAIDPGVGSVTIMPANTITTRTPIVFFVNEKTQIVKNEKVVPFSALAVKDLCKAVVVKLSDGRFLAQSVYAKSPTPSAAIAIGRIDKIDYTNSVFTLRSDNRLAPAPVVTLFSADVNTVINKNGKPVGFADLKTGDVAAVSYIPPMTLVVGLPVHAISIEAKTAPEMIGSVYGRLVEIDPVARVIGIRPMNTIISATVPVVRLRVTDKTNIDKFGAASFDALALGDVVNATFFKTMDALIPAAISISVAPDAFQGFVTGVDAEKGIIIAQVSPMGISMMFNAAKATFFKNGKPATIKDIQAKDTVMIRFFHFKDGNVAISVYAKSPVSITPPVTR